MVSYEGEPVYPPEPEEGYGNQYKLKQVGVSELMGLSMSVIGQLSFNAYYGVGFRLKSH